MMIPSATSDSTRPQRSNDTAVPPEIQLAAYYRSPAVRARIAEYCGGPSPQGFRAFGLAGQGGRRGLHRSGDDAPQPVCLDELESLFDDGADVCRSLADRDGTLIQMDIDYVDPGDPTDIYLHPAACFARMEPIYRAVRSVFQRFGVPTIDLLTARGYHLITRIPAHTPFHAALIEGGRIGAPLYAKYQATGGEAHVQLGRAHEGAGRLLEHLAHRVIRKLRGKTTLPVVLADVPRAGGGPYVCLDLSAHGDPLFERNIRCAFSSNQKAREVTPSRPFTINLPRRGLSLPRLLQIRKNPSRAARLAARVHTMIPDAAGHDLRWVDDYRRGALARFHASFDEGWHDPPSEWPQTYNSLDLRSLPRCVALPLERPNPGLLQPVWIRTVALALWAERWHPRSIAGLIRSKYERDFGWGSMWYRYDAAARADFYVRVFCGAMACGIDSEFTCALQVARGACPLPGCGHDLSEYAHTSEWRS
jgi:hypothetical protein